MMNSHEPGGPPRQRRVTLKQVAEELGVSQMTVSNAYNRPTQLSPALRERVLETARRLGYAGPDPTARGLRRGRTGAVGVIYDTRLSYAFEDPAAVAFLRGVSDAAERDRLGLLLVPGSSAEQRDAAVINDAIVDGFIVYSVAERDPLVEAALERGIPTVVVDQPRLEGVPFVGIDDRSSARAAARHLVDLGHRECAVVSFGLSRRERRGLAGAKQQESADYQVTRARLEGYADALSAAALFWPDVPVYECPGSSPAFGREATDALLESSKPFTALLATSDQLALGAIDAAEEAGLSVPRDLSVIGFDDIPEAATSRPALTTVRQGHLEKGRVAGAVLIAQMRGLPVESPTLLPAHLVVRGSTAPPPRR